MEKVNYDLRKILKGVLKHSFSAVDLDIFLQTILPLAYLLTIKKRSLRCVQIMFTNLSVLAVLLGTLELLQRQLK